MIDDADLPAPFVADPMTHGYVIRHPETLDVLVFVSADLPDDHARYFLDKYAAVARGRWPADHPSTRPSSSSISPENDTPLPGV